MKHLRAAIAVRHFSMGPETIYRTVHPAPTQGTRILSFSELKEDIKKESCFRENTSKIKIRSLPRFGALLNGFRSGELTIFSGPTGSGKTTVLSQLSLDLCMQGVQTLWGSFEIRNSRLGLVMAQQMANSSLVDENSKYRQSELASVSEKLSKLPLYFLDFFGSTDMAIILNNMVEAVKTKNVQHILLDNLQFILSEQYMHKMDKFDLSDKTISALRSFCNIFNVHVTLVVHPRKEDDNTQLGISSLSGTAKVSQEADNIIILQSNQTGRYLEVKKNRYEGTVGSVKLRFEKERKLVFEDNESNKNIE